MLTSGHYDWNCHSIHVICTGNLPHGHMEIPILQLRDKRKMKRLKLQNVKTWSMSSLWFTNLCCAIRKSKLKIICAKLLCSFNQYTIDNLVPKGVPWDPLIDMPLRVIDKVSRQVLQLLEVQGVSVTRHCTNSLGTGSGFWWTCGRRLKNNCKVFLDKLSATVIFLAYACPSVTN